MLADDQGSTKRLKWNATTNTDLIFQAKTLLSRVRLLSPTTLIWVLSHANIFGNKLADLLAKRGAAGITDTAFPSSDELGSIRTPSP